MSQNREHVRLEADRPVLVYIGKDRQPVHTYTVELSGGGLLLAGPHVLEIDEEIEFKLTLAPDREPIVGIGRVVRNDSRGRRAIAFSQMSDGNRRRLVRFIFERERAERRRMLEADERNGS